MKIMVDADNKVFQYDREPMSPERFSTVCKLVGAAIAGAVFLGIVHMVGFWAIPWAVGVLVAVGVYKLLVQGL